ncbi:MAG: hypothetical protein JWM12_3566, partial [Ilumatobacteraceae bacterium]|nr:hypothetical protein [Ilumatobacteraceae bacterium]
CETVLEQACAGRGSLARDTLRRRRDATLVEVSVIISPVLDSDGRPVGVAAIARDISERKALVRALAEDRNRLADAQRIASVGSFDRDPSGWHIWSNELYRILDVDPDTIPGDSTYLSAVHEDDRAEVGEAMAAVIGTGGRVRIEHRVRTRDGRVRWVLGQADTSESDEGRVVGAILDITERKRAEEALTYQSRHDPLTGLPSRVVFAQRLEMVIARAAHHSAAVMFLDVDQFKVINDGMGHAAGDELLVSIAGRLNSWARPADTVTRFGGDEFVILCEDLGSIDQALARARDVVALFERPFSIGGRQLFVTASIGVTAVPEGADVGGVLRDADAAMYCAKEGGRAGVVVADDAMRERALARLELEAALGVAVARDELLLEYQPVVDLSTERIVGYEALLRWQHPQLGLLQPDQFIELAEATGLVVPIGRWVLRHALEQLAAWRASTSDMSHVFMAVNVATKQLYNGDIAGDVEAMLVAAGIDPGSLHLEITETALLDLDRASEALTSLKAIGTHIELDDFGTGYSSLSYLQKLPIDTLKIDRSFVANLGHDVQSTAIVEAIISLGGALGLRVLAEGVENTRQRDLLAALGCQLAQGYLWSRPVPGDQIELLSGSSDPPNPTRASRPRADVPCAAGLGPHRGLTQIDVRMR